MPYQLTKSNGILLTTVQDAVVDNTSTSLTFVGRNYSGYGQSIEENFVHLLENFANSSSPANPLQGQLWYNTGTQQLNINADGANWKGIGSITVGSTATTNVSPSVGDFWWDTDVSQLIVYDGTSYVNIGPTSTSSFAAWTLGKPFNGIPGIIGTVYNQPVLTVSSHNGPYTPSDTSTFKTIQQGITLAGADPITGSTGHGESGKYYFWGTAAESLAAVSVELTPSVSTSSCYVPFAGQTVNAGTNLTTASSFTYNPSTGVLNATATAAYYADIAERYEADAEYEVGTVLVIGGEKEVTTTDQFADTRVAGIVSKNPAYMMNSGAGTDETHPYIALKGRVPCKVVGFVEKGDLLVTSAHAGYATAANSVSAGSVIGKALENHSEGFGVIEVLVV